MSFMSTPIVNRPTDLSIMARFRSRWDGPPGGGDTPPPAASGASSGGGQMSDWPEFPATMTDTFHNPAFNYNIYAVANGNWSNSGIWSLGRYPVSGDIVRISDDAEINYDLNSSGSLKAVGVGYGGCLMFQNNIDTKLVTGTMFILKMGCLEIGVSGNPIGGGFTARLAFPDRPLDTSYDPFQFNHGLVCLGEFTSQGQAKSAGCTRLGAEPSSGNVIVTMSGVVSGWLSGDTVFIPDSRQFKDEELPGGSGGNPGYVNFDDLMTMHYVSGTNLGLASPGLRYAHRSARDTSGVYNYHAHCVNLTRNVKIYSENPVGSGTPTGSRGHVMFTGDMCNFVCNFTEFKDLGRTTHAPLDNTAGTYGNISAIGTNQFGRYAFHVHHVHYEENDDWVFKTQGCSLWNSTSGADPRKWAITVHNSHFGLIKDAVCYNFTGAGVMTETGSEAGNLFDNVFVGTIRGYGIGISSPDSRGWGVGIGFEGFCFWLRGTLCRFRNCAGANAPGGWGYFNTNLPIPMNPPAWSGTHGGEYSYNPYTVGMGEQCGSECYGGGMLNGYTFWDVGVIGNSPQSGSVPVFFSGAIAWHIRSRYYDNYRINNFVFDGFTMRGDPLLLAAGSMPVGYYGGDYAFHSGEFRNCDLQNLGFGFYTTSQGISQTFKGCTLKNYWNIIVGVRWQCNSPVNELDRDIYVRDCNFSLPTFTLSDQPPPANIRADSVLDIGGGTTSLVHTTRIWVSGYNNSGTDNFRVYYSGQRRQAFLPQTQGTGPYPDPYRGSPLSGLTNQQNFDTYPSPVSGLPGSGLCFANELPPSGLTARSGIIGLLYYSGN